MATKSAGRVSIRVLPDSTRFKEDLEKSLRRMERTMRAKIPVELELAREELAKLKRQIQSLVIKIRPTIELNVSAADIAAMKAKIEAARPVVNVTLNTVDASRRMANLSRSRRIDMRPILNNRAVANFVAKMKGLAGLNVIGDSFKEGMQFFQEIDRNAVKFGALLSKFGIMASLIGAMVGNLVVMGAQLASMANIGILFPAFFTGMAISVAIAVAAFKDMKTVLADLGPKMSAFQDSISKDFWAEAAEPIRRMTNYLLPLLNTTDGTTNTARSLGKFFGEIANSITELLTADKLNLMMDRMNRSIDILTKAVRPLTNSFINLGIVGSGYFERFSNWIVKLSNQFDAFITRSAENGDLDRWIENSIQGFKDMGNTIRGVVRILDAIHTAAVKAGSVNFGQFAESLNKAADTMNSPRFQAVMVTLFEGMNKAVAGVVDGVKKLGPAIESAAPSISRVLGTIGDIASKVGGMLAGIISNPVLQKGIEDFMTSVSKSLTILEPAVKPFAESLGGVFDLMGKVIEKLAELSNKIIVELGPIFDKMGAKFAELIDPISNTLKKVVDNLKPVLETMYTEVIVKLVDFINNQALPAIDKLVVLLGPAFKRGLEEVGTFIDEVLTPIFKTLNETLDKLDGKGDTIAGIFDIPKLADPKSMFPDLKGGWLTDPGAMKEDWDNFKRPFNEEFNKWVDNELPKFEDSVNQGLEDFWKGVGENIGNFDDSVNQGLEDFWNGIGEGIKKSWDDMWGGLDDWWQGVKSKFQDWMSEKLGFNTKPSGPGSVTVGAGMGGKGSGVTGKITPEMLGMGEPDDDWLTGLDDKVNQSLEDFWAGLGENIEKLTEDFKTSWNDFWGGLGTKVQEIWDGIVLWVQTKYTELKTGLDTWIEEVKTGWTEFWDGLGTKVQEAWQGFLDWIELKKTEIKTAIDTWIEDVKTNWNNFWTTVGEWLRTKWDEMVQWVKDKANEIKTNVDTFIADVKRNWEEFWNKVAEKVRTAWDDMIQKIKDKINEAVEFVKSLPQKAQDALADAGEKLKSSGASLVQGFIDGMGTMIENAKTKAAEIVQAVKDFFPHSPAKKGPLSGKGYTTHSGRALVGDFASGMMDNMAKVRKATAAVADAAQLASAVNLETDLDQDGVVIDRSQTIIHTYNPVAEPTSRTIEKSANNIRMAKAI